MGDSKVKLTDEIYLPCNGPLDAPERIKGIRNKATCLGEVVESGTLRGPGRSVPSIGGMNVLEGKVLADMGKEDIPIR